MDLYFAEPIPSQPDVDIIRCNQAPQCVPAYECTPFSTIVIELTESLDIILAKMTRRTRERIKKADRERLQYEYSDGEEARDRDEYADHFDYCGRLKGLVNVSRVRMQILAHHHALSLSLIRDEAGSILAACCHVVMPGRVRLLYAGAPFRASQNHEFRSRIGRVNRYLFWRDIVRFKQREVSVFDFGGYYDGKDDKEKMKINIFKSEFGGVVRHEFNCQKALSWKGRIALWALRRRQEQSSL
jgi:hypothetical protein